MNELNRVIQPDFLNWLYIQKILILTGARQVGKTTLFRQMFGTSTEEILWLNADESNVRERLGDLNVASLKMVVGDYKLIVIDEIQRIENSGVMLKLLVDNFKDVQVVATGSSALDISEKIFEPLTGRHLVFHLYPFSLKELYPTKSIFEIENELYFHLVFGSYPDICKYRTKAPKLLKNLANQYLYKDVLVWKDIRKPEMLDKLLKLLAYQIGNEVSINELASQLRVKSETVETYMDLLEKAFVIFRLNAYSTNSRKEVTKMSKIYFWDVGIRNAIVESFDVIAVRQDVGMLWENFMISERMKMNAWLHPERKSYFWRNYNQSEVDYVEVEGNELYAVEFKWSTRKKHSISKAFTNAYPAAKTKIVTPLNFAEFAQLI